MTDATILSIVGIVVSAILGIFSAILGLVGTIFAGVVTYFIAKLRTQSKEIHDVVNSTASKLKEKADQNEREIMALKETVSRLEEKIRGKDESLAVSNATNTDSFSAAKLKQLRAILSK